MYERKDYILRMIQEFIRMLVKLAFGKNTALTDDLETDQKLADRFSRLRSMVDDGNLNGAENQLLMGMNPQSPDDYKLALLFYQYLNDKDEDFLVKNQYSKKEIFDGLQKTAEIYGYGYITDIFPWEES